MGDLPGVSATFFNPLHTDVLTLNVLNPKSFQTQNNNGELAERYWTH